MSKYVLAFLTMILVFFGIYSMQVDIGSQAAIKNSQYQNYLTTATYDAAKEMHQSMVDNIALPEEKDREKVIKTFFNSLAMDFGYTTNEDMNRLHLYVPVVALIDTNGYYIAYNYEGKDPDTNEHKLFSVITSINTWTTNLSGEKGTYIVRYYLGHLVSVITPDGDEFYGSQEDVLSNLSGYSSVDADKFKTELGFTETPNETDALNLYDSKRNSVIIMETEEKIEYYINQHNKIAESYNTSYTFSLPETDQDDWIRLVQNPTCIAFLQGMQVSNTTGYLNIYSLSGGELSKNKELSFANTDGTKQYYKDNDDPLSSSQTSGYMPNESSIAKTGDTMNTDHDFTDTDIANASMVKHGGDSEQHYHKGNVIGNIASLYGGCYIAPVFHQHTDDCYKWQSNMKVYSYVSGVNSNSYQFFVTDTSRAQDGSQIEIKAKDYTGTYSVIEDDTGIYVNKNGTKVQIATITTATGSGVKESVTSILGGPNTSYTIPVYHDHDSEACYSYVFHSHKGSQVPDENRMQVIKRMYESVLGGADVRYKDTTLTSSNFDRTNYRYITLNGVTYYASAADVIEQLDSSQLFELNDVANISNYTCYTEAGYHIHTTECYASQSGETVYVKVPVYHRHTMPIVHYTSINNPDLDLTEEDVTKQISAGINGDYYPYYIENLEASCLYNANQRSQYYKTMTFTKADGSQVEKKVVDLQFLYTGSSQSNTENISSVNFRCGKTEETVDHYEQKYQMVNGEKVPVTVVAKKKGDIICGHSSTEIESYYNTCGKIDKNKMTALEKAKWDAGIWTWDTILENGVDSTELSCGKTLSTVESWGLPDNADPGTHQKVCTKYSLNEIKADTRYRALANALSDNLISKAEYNNDNGIRTAITSLTANGSITGWRLACGHEVGESVNKAEESLFTN